MEETIVEVEGERGLRKEIKVKVPICPQPPIFLQRILKLLNNVCSAVDKSYFYLGSSTQATLMSP